MYMFKASHVSRITVEIEKSRELGVNDLRSGYLFATSCDICVGLLVIINMAQIGLRERPFAPSIAHQMTTLEGNDHRINPVSCLL